RHRAAHRNPRGGVGTRSRRRLSDQRDSHAAPAGRLKEPLMKKLHPIAAALFLIVLMASHDAFAVGSNMPWAQPLEQILTSIQGPVARIIAVIIIIITGLTLAFGDTAGGFRRLIQIVFGLTIAFAASSFFLSFFSFGGGALI